MKVLVAKKFLPKIKNGYPLIEKDALVMKEPLQQEGLILELVDDKNRFIGRGYFGIQNKGYGWILTRKAGERIDGAFFEKKLDAAIKRRKSFFEQTETTAFRVFNGEGDGIGGLTIDFYADYYVITWYSEGMYQFKEYVLNALQNLVSFKAIYQKKRFSTNGKYIEEDDFVCGERGDFPILVKENGVNYAVYLDDGAMVGIFLDQREVRKRIRDSYAKGKTVLNTFSYTGAFSVAAALGGAEKTTSVDLANRSLSKTIEQFQLNGLDEKEHDIIVEDVFHYFKYARKKGKKYDIVILDPPSFARSKKHIFSAIKDYKDLLKEAIAITENNGVMVASTNASNFNMARFKQFIETAFQETGEDYKILEEHTLPEDFQTTPSFPEGNYLKVVFIKKG